MGQDKNFFILKVLGEEPGSKPLWVWIGFSKNILFLPFAILANHVFIL